MTTLEIIQTNEFDELIVSQEVVTLEVYTNISQGLPGPPGDPGPRGLPGVSGTFSGIYPYYMVNTSQDLPSNYGYYLASGALALNLPNPSIMDGQKIDIKNIDKYNIVVSSAVSIDGSPSIVLGPNDSVSLLGTSVGWFIV